MDEKDEKEAKNIFPQARRSYGEGFDGPRRLLNRIFLRLGRIWL